MQPSARYQAVFELISEIFKDQNPADQVIYSYTRKRKYIGSKDRRFIVDTVWDIVRHRLRLRFDASSDDPRKILIYYLKDQDFDLITGGDYGLKPLTKEEKLWLNALKDEVYPKYVELECPKWLYDKISDENLIESLNEPASIDIRANFISAQELKNRLKGEGLFFSFMPYSPFGLRSSERFNINNCMAYKEGLFDLQDEACQVAALLCHAKASEKIIDYCAGAGGKSLAIGALLLNEGIVYAHDINFNRMDVIKERSERLGIKNIKIIKNLTDRDYDCFILDSPCSGSGTWRRAPDAKFRFSLEKLEELKKIQKDILEIAYQHTKKGGRIIYMTCSILKDENEDVVEEFQAKHKDVSFLDHEKLWLSKIDAPYPFLTNRYIQFSPLKTNTDGFFFCGFKKE